MHAYTHTHTHGHARTHIHTPEVGREVKDRLQCLLLGDTTGLSCSQPDIQFLFGHLQWPRTPVSQPHCFQPRTEGPSGKLFLSMSNAQPPWNCHSLFCPLSQTEQTEPFPRLTTLPKFEDSFMAHYASVPQAMYSWFTPQFLERGGFQAFYQRLPRLSPCPELCTVLLILSDEGRVEEVCHHYCSRHRPQNAFDSPVSLPRLAVNP